MRRGGRAWYAVGVGCVMCCAVAVSVSASPLSASVTNARAGLSANQTIHLTASPANPGRRVIVVFRNQHGDLATRGGFNSARSERLAVDQTPVLTELREVRATDVRAYSALNAVSATVSQAEGARLAADPSVLEVVPDLTRTLPVRPEQPAPGPASRAGAAGASSAPATSCPSDPSKPLLEPEALQLTSTAFSDPSLPQAQEVRDGNGALVTGTGVKVAFIADGLDTNDPDFIRADGTHVFVDYRDFGGDGPGAPTEGAEAFGDASSIAAQGRQVYDLSKYVDPAHRLPSGCNIVVRGMAPGASLVGLDVFGDHGQFASTSAILQGIDWAVNVDHVDVINESIGDNPFPDTEQDPVALADNVAIAGGITITASSGDGGETGTVGSAATDPAVIDVGATTAFRTFAQQSAGGFGFSTSGQFESDQIAAFSSGGVLENGRTVDLVAPGEDGWALCSTKRTIYSECLNNAGGPSAILDFGGTSESAPLTAGAAALVIQAYKSTHSGLRPAPALVKKLLTSTADDLGHPAYEQGAGRLNSLRAVQAALSIADSNGNPAPQGAALLSDTEQINVTDQPGRAHTDTVTLTNTGDRPQVVSGSVRTLAGPTDEQTGSVSLASATGPSFVDEFGRASTYRAVGFNVPAGADRLNTAIAYVNRGNTPVRITLINPHGDYANYSAPQGIGDYGQVEVGSPMPGRWTAYIWATKPFSGAVAYQFYSSHYVAEGTVTPPSATLQPGASGAFLVNVVTPSAPGDSTAAITWNSAGNYTTSTPIVLRTLVPVTQSAGGSFNGVITGGNGRGGAPGQTNVFAFDVPAHTQDVSVSMRLLGNHNTEVDGYLVSPSGQALSIESNVSALVTADPVAGAALQLTHADPAPGRWTFLSVLSTPVAGTETSQPFQGHVLLNTIRVSAPGLPDSSAITLSPTQPKTINVTVRNNGVVTEGAFTDARLVTTRDLTLPVADGAKVKLPLPLEANGPSFTLAPETQSVTVTGKANIPLAFDVFSISSILNPDIASVAVGPTSATGTASASELPAGPWAVNPSNVGPYPSKGAAHGTANFTATAHMRAFDPAITTSAGDFWLSAVEGAPSPFLDVIKPGGSATIPVTIKARGAAGTVVRGTLFIDTLGWLGSGDELAALPYTYTVK